MQLMFGTREYINSIIEDYKFEVIQNKYGKPIVNNKSLYFNKSHTKDLSVLIIDDKLCGIDIENIREYNELMARKICSKCEYDYLQKSSSKDYDYTLLWVIKESYLKCIGVGLSFPLKKINFVENDKLMQRKEDFYYKILNYKNCIISICRKV